MPYSDSDEALLYRDITPMVVYRLTAGYALEICSNCESFTNIDDASLSSKFEEVTCRSGYTYSYDVCL
jgi:hypothetical protein